MQFSMIGLGRMGSSMVPVAVVDRALGDLFDELNRKQAAIGLPCEDIVFELALQDLAHAADRFRPAFDDSSGSDGWPSLELSPMLANDADGTWDAVCGYRARALTRAEASTRIAGRLRDWVDVFEAGRLSRPAGTA